MRRVGWVALVAGLLILVGCAAPPTMTAWRPWTRTLPVNASSLSPHATIALSVHGTTEPLAGTEALFQGSLARHCKDALKRHGYVVTESNATYQATLSYRTVRREAMDIQSSFATSTVGRTASAVGAGAAAGAGVGALGIGIAEAVQRATIASSSAATTSVRSGAVYMHTVGLEIADQGGVVVWKGESAWDSKSVDLASSARMVLGLLVSDLPSDPQVTTPIEEIKPTHVGNYYKLYCSDPYFSCPGLPYLISFELATELRLSGDVTAASQKSTDARAAHLPTSIVHGNALAAYRDLIENAEIALPLGGGRSAWKNPLDPKLWSKVRLGGRYTLGPARKPASVLVTLQTGTAANGTCYFVREARTATPEEFAVFERDLGDWQLALKQFYGMSVE